MKKFIFSAITYFVLGIALIIIGVLILHTYKPKVYTFENIPPPNLVNSFSYNLKLEFIATKKADCIAVGSSLTQNNLYSKLVVDSLHIKDYLNLSSWGLRVKDIYKLIKLYSTFNKPRVILTVGNYTDFLGGFKTYDERELYDYISQKHNIIAYLNHFDLTYYFDKFEFVNRAAKTLKIHESLCYDEYGAVLLEPEGFQYQKQRWNDLGVNGTLDKENYWYLDSICSYCKEREIEFIYIQSPYREGVLDRADEYIPKNHLIRIKKIVTNYQFNFIDGNELIWNDSLFVDGTHMNKYGAETFTNYWLSKLYH